MTGWWIRARTAWTTLTGTGAAASAALGLLVLGCVFLAVAAPREALALRTRALQAQLAQLSPMGRSVYATQDYSAFEVIVHPADAAAIVATRATLARHLAAAGLPLAAASSDWSGLTAGFQPVSGAPAAFYTAQCTPPELEVLYRDKLPGSARLAAGRLPDTASSLRGGTEFQAVVTQATAARFGLRIGSRLGIGQRNSLVVVGIVRPSDPGLPFWTADPAATAPQLQADQNPNCPPYWTGAAFVGPAELRAVESQFDIANLSVSWDYPLSLRAAQASQAVGLQASLTGAETQAGQLGTGIGYLSASGTPVSLTSGVGSVLDSFIAQDQAVGSVLSLMTVSLTAVAAAVVLLASFVIADHRSAEFALLEARGAGRWQLAVLVLRPGAAVALAAAAGGAYLADRVTPHDNAPLSWWLAGFTLLVAVVGPPTVAAMRPRPADGTDRDEPAPGSRLSRVRRVIIEATLTGAAAGGLVVLRQHAQPGGDLYTELAPVLVAIPAALLMMRCYPVLLRMLIRLTGRMPGATAFVGLARAARTAPRAILPAFALVLALAAVGFCTMMRASVARGDVTASWQRVGADALVNATTSAAAATPAVGRAISAVPGAEHVALVQLGTGRTARGMSVAVAAVNPSRYAAFTAATPLPAFPAGKLAWPRPGRAAGPVPVLATARAAAALGTGPALLDIGSRQVEVRVSGVIPGLAWAQGAAVMLPVTALRGTPVLPNVVLIAGHHLDGQRLATVVQRELPGAIITLRSAVLTAQAAAPLPHGASQALAMGSVAAIGLTVLVVLIALVLSAQSRERTLVRLEVMGLSQRQARWLVVAEVLPQVMVAVVGGVASAVALAPLLAPAIDLAALTGSPTPVLVTAQPVPLGIAAAALVVVAVLTLSVQTAVAGRQEAFQGLRVVDE